MLFRSQALKDGFQTLHARVTRVADGDTVYIKDDEGKEARVRLLGIDAPESKQAYGVQSAEHLKRNLRDAEYHVQVIYRGRDQYGRIIGKLVADGKDLNLDQVSTGNAWVYRNYLKDLQPGDKNLYLKAEDNARAKRIGLWADPNPQNPRDWRREHPRN
nr:thermonuclease family protein [Parasutterella excrementihominis]